MSFGAEVNLLDHALVVEHLAVARAVLIAKESETVPALCSASKWKKRGRLLTVHIAM